MGSRWIVHVWLQKILLFVILSIAKNLKTYTLCLQILRYAQDDTMIGNLYFALPPTKRLKIAIRTLPFDFRLGEIHFRMENFIQ